MPSRTRRPSERCCDSSFRARKTRGPDRALRVVGAHYFNSLALRSRRTSRQSTAQRRRARRTCRDLCSGRAGAAARQYNNVGARNSRRRGLLTERHCAARHANYCAACSASPVGRCRVMPRLVDGHPLPATATMPGAVSKTPNGGIVVLVVGDVGAAVAVGRVLLVVDGLGALAVGSVVLVVDFGVAVGCIVGLSSWRLSAAECRAACRRRPWSNCRCRRWSSNRRWPRVACRLSTRTPRLRRAALTAIRMLSGGHLAVDAMSPPLAARGGSGREGLNSAQYVGLPSHRSLPTVT